MVFYSLENPKDLSIYGPVYALIFKAYRYCGSLITCQLLLAPILQSGYTLYWVWCRFWQCWCVWLCVCWEKTTWFSSPHNTTCETTLCTAWATNRWHCKSLWMCSLYTDKAGGASHLDSTHRWFSVKRQSWCKEIQALLGQRTGRKWKSMKMLSCGLYLPAIRPERLLETSCGCRLQVQTPLLYG